MVLTQRERLHLENALAQIALAEAAADALRYSFEQRPLVQDTRQYTPLDWERLDALTVRFARLADVLTQRVWRVLDLVEFEPPAATFLDRVARAEKRDLIGSALAWKEIRELRNEIVHEYVTASLMLLLANVIRHTPELLQATSRLARYKKTFQTRLAETSEDNG